MKRTLRRIGLSASLAATMALAGAAPAVAGHPLGHPTKSQGQGPKLITGNPGKGATVIHCKRLPGAGAAARGVIVITPSGNVHMNCRGLPPGFKLPVPAAQQLIGLFPVGQFPAILVPLLPPEVLPLPTPQGG